MSSIADSRLTHLAFGLGPTARSSRPPPRPSSPIVLLALAAITALRAFMLAPAYAISPDAEAMLSQAEKAAAWIDNSAVALKARCHWSNRAGQHAETDHDVRHYLSGNGKLHSQDTITVFNADGTPKSTTLFETILADSQFVTYIPGLSAMISTTPQRVDMLRAASRCNSSAGAFLEGRLRAGDAGDVSVFDLARQLNATLRPQPEQINGVECRLLEATTPSLDLQIWIAPSKGYNLAKFIVHQKSSRGQRYKSFKAVFDQAEFQEQAGRIFVTRGRLQTQSVTQSPEEMGYADLSETVVVTRISIDPNPKFLEPALFTFNGIADGTRVRLDDGPNSGGPLYVWQDGQPVPFVDAKTTSALRSEIDAYQQSATAGQTPQPDNATTPTALAHNSTNLWIAVAAAALAATIVGAGYALARRKIA